MLIATSKDYDNPLKGGSKRSHPSNVFRSKSIVWLNKLLSFSFIMIHSNILTFILFFFAYILLADIVCCNAWRVLYMFLVTQTPIDFLEKLSWKELDGYHPRCCPNWYPKAKYHYWENWFINNQVFMILKKMQYLGKLYG